MSLMVSISGIRGIVGSSLTPEVVVRYVSAFAEYCGRGTVVIGRDGRVTGSSIGHVVSSTLLQMGCDVKAIGVCPTPTVALAVEKLKAAGGISITASHNPMEWNGLKFFAPTGLFLNAEENRRMWEIANRPERTYAPWNRQGKHVAIPEFVDRHISSILALPMVNKEKIRRRNLKAVVDCVNASGSFIVPGLLRRLGVKTVEMNCDGSGVFAHTPEPIPENLTSLCARVRKEKADIGIAVDPDADRLVLIDERGNPLGEEYTIATAVNFVLSKTAKRKGRTVVVNLSTTRAVDEIAARHGAAVVRTPVGEINVAKRMKETGAIVGGEGSGGVILPKAHLGRDAMVGIALVLQQLAEFGGTLSEFKATLPRYEITKGKVEVGSWNADEALRRVRDMYAPQGRVNEDDGLKIDFDDSWVHLRKSNTEPIVRIIAEAPTKSAADNLVRQFTNDITRAAGQA